ncbi:MAG: short-chain dehydrogenase [Pedosphaera sp. Tous-C6FEB]|nr:MAG: short-chain dehydrogenase [Pedosphaera sp. Tous-C6FEB]
MSTDKKLSGKTALITGASKGLGKAMALAFADAGARLALASRDTELLAAVQAECRARGAEAEIYQVDVTSEEQVEQLRRDVLARFGKLTILVNNAGINIRRPVTEFTLAEWHQILDTNLTSVFLMCRAFVPHLETGCGRILNLASMMAHVSIAHRVPYSASKFGILGLTKSLALEVAAQGITVNAISPGPCATEINTPILNNPELLAKFTAQLPVGRFGKPEEVAALAVFLASGDSGFITGTDVVIDGGWIAQ